MFVQKDAVWQRMVDASFEMIEKYSSYDRAELERCGKTIHQQWTDMVGRFRSECDLPRANYVLDLAEEKRIGKAKVTKNVSTAEEVFSLLANLEITKDNYFLARDILFLSRNP